MIRPYTSADLEAVLNLLKLNTPEYFHPSEEKDFIEYLHHKRDAYFVVEVDHKIVGCGGYNLGFDHGKTARISWDMIHPDAQGSGIGSLLITHRIDAIKNDKNINKIIVRTSQFAYKFYAKFGFTLDSIIENYWSHGFDLYEMHIKTDQ